MTASNVIPFRRRHGAPPLPEQGRLGSFDTLIASAPAKAYAAAFAMIQRRELPAEGFSTFVSTSGAELIITFDGLHAEGHVTSSAARLGWPVVHREIDTPDGRRIEVAARSYQDGLLRTIRCERPA